LRFKITNASGGKVKTNEKFFDKLENSIYIANPTPRDTRRRTPNIPDSVKKEREAELKHAEVLRMEETEEDNEVEW
jgi:hypothetical protein